MAERRERIAFLLGKDPELARGGDITLFELMRSVADERYETELICLSEEPGRLTPGITRVAKPRVARRALAASALRTGRSLVHTRFDVAGLTDAIDSSRATRFVAVHAYLAEAYLRSNRADPAGGLHVSTEVSEVPVWRSRGGAWRIEAHRIARDEWRVARAARAVGGYDAAEMAAYQAGGIAHAHWLPLTLPPQRPVEVGGTPPRLVLLGNRHWAPNAQAAERMLTWWPEIAAGIRDAELWLVGPRPAGPAAGAGLSGVLDHGEVEDVTPLLAACRAMVAPVRTGGGVRVKVLEAAAHGLPVVASPAGVSSIEGLLGLTPVTDADFVARCRALLQDAAVAAAEGRRLHAANAALWEQRTGRDAVLAWLAS